MHELLQLIFFAFTLQARRHLRQTPQVLRPPQQQHLPRLRKFRPQPWMHLLINPLLFQNGSDNLDQHVSSLVAFLSFFLIKSVLMAIVDQHRRRQLPLSHRKKTVFVLFGN